MANGNDQGLLGQIGQGIMQASRSPAFNVGLGLLSAAGPSQQQMSTGQRLARGFQTGMGMQQRALQNQEQRRQMQQRQRQREAREELQGLLSTDLPPQSIRRPGAAQQRQQEMMGLLSQAQPEAFEAGLIQQMTQQPQEEPQEVQLVRALRDPTLDQDQRELLRRSIAGSGANDQLLQRIDMMVRMAELERLEREEQQQREEERRSEAEMASGLRQDLNDAQKLAELNQRLRDTALETGLPVPELRREAAAAAEAGRNILGAISGEDLSDRETQRAIADFDQFNKIAARFAGSTAMDLYGEGGLTNQQLSQVQQQTPSASLSPIANNRIIASQIDTLLSGANRAGVDLTEEERSQYRSFVEQLRSRENLPEQNGGDGGNGQGGGTGSGDGGDGDMQGVIDSLTDGDGVTSLQPAGPAPSQTQFDAEQQPVLGFAERLPQRRQNQVEQAEQFIRNASEAELTEFADRASELPPRLRQALDQRLNELGF